MKHAKNTKNVTVEPALFESYLAFIKGSVGSNMFRKFYADVTVEGGGKATTERREVLDDGRISCAVHVSAILKLFNLCENIQITVHRLLDDMEQSNWYEINEPRKGAMVLWAANDEQAEKDKGSKIQVPRNKHTGFCIGNNEAVSNRKEQSTPIVHSLHYRKVQTYFWHDELNH